MNKLYLSIFWKIVVILIITITFFGILNITLVWNKVFKIIDDETIKRIIQTGQNLADQSIHLILYNDLSSLQNIIENADKNDPLIIYCMVQDNNYQVLAHTFAEGIPKELLRINHNFHNEPYKYALLEISNYKISNIKDYKIPILEGKIGFLRIGIDYKQINNDLNQTLVNFIIIFIVFTLLGFIGAFILTYLITNPIKKINKAFDKLDLQNLSEQNTKELIIIKRGKIVYPIRIYDEIDDLINKFNDMILRLKETYEKLLSTQKAMTQSEKLASLGTLVAGISHEINNPISGLMSCLRRISEQPYNIDQNIKYIKIMNEAILKMKSVIDSLLNFSRKSSGKKDYYDLKKIIENSLNILSLNKDLRNIELDWNLTNNNLLIYCNRNEMEQVFFNILKNSIDAINEKSKIYDRMTGSIRLDLFREENTIKIEIADNGIGIKEENLSKIFDPFFTTKEVGKGTGLGCSICYNIISDHNGEIKIFSEYLRGTKVQISFPTFLTKNVYED